MLAAEEATAPVATVHSAPPAGAPPPPAPMLAAEEATAPAAAVHSAPPTAAPSAPPAPMLATEEATAPAAAVHSSPSATPVEAYHVYLSWQKIPLVAANAILLFAMLMDCGRSP